MIKDGLSNLHIYMVSATFNTVELISEFVEKTGTMQVAFHHQRTTVREDLNC